MWAVLTVTGLCLFAKDRMKEFGYVLPRKFEKENKKILFFSTRNTQRHSQQYPSSALL